MLFKIWELLLKSNNEWHFLLLKKYTLNPTLYVNSQSGKGKIRCVYGKMVQYMVTVGETTVHSNKYTFLFG